MQLKKLIQSSIKIKNKIENATDIVSVDVKTYFWAVNKHDHQEIPSVASAKMSIPYSVAVGLIFGKAGLEEYTEEMINNAQVLQLTRKVSVYSDEEITALFPKITKAVVQVKMKSGQLFTKSVDIPKGEPENAFTENEFKERFVDLIKYGGKTETIAENIWKCVQNLDGSMKELFDYL